MIIAASLFSEAAFCGSLHGDTGGPAFKNQRQAAVADKNDSLSVLNGLMRSYLQNDDALNCVKIVDVFMAKAAHETIKDTSSLAESYYLAGICYFKLKQFGTAAKMLEKTASLKERLKEYDKIYANALYNLGVAYYMAGDFIMQLNATIRSLEIEKKIVGGSNPLLLKTYLNIITAFIGLKDYERALEYSNIALGIANQNRKSADSADLADIYNNLGVTYIHLADYSKAKVFLEQTELINKLLHIPINDSYFSLLNNMAITYGFLGMSEKSNEYYRKGIELAKSFNSQVTYNFINSYAISLGQAGQVRAGEKLLSDAVLKARQRSGENSVAYFTILFDYAEYLRDIRKDNRRALEYYRACIDFLEKDKSNLSLKQPVNLGYALSLAETGNTGEAMDIIQNLLFQDYASGKPQKSASRNYPNPDLSEIRPDKLSLSIIKAKYDILKKIFTRTGNIDILKNESSTAMLLVGVIEKVRINISEEDSRLILGDRYRDAYINAISDFCSLYGQTDEQVYMDDAYVLAEKSKVAGLLAATRELNATEFNIPANLALLESSLKRDISFLAAKIDDEKRKENPDTSLIETWKENILKQSMQRDSLVSVFEKNYPGYFAFKYNTSVTSLNQLPRIIGRRVNYINYVVSDSVVYIFIANSRNRHLLAVPVDTSFFADIRKFRSLLGMPSPSADARADFENFRLIGSRIYGRIIEPVKPYLISGRLLISPDNILSYLPLETLPVSASAGEELMYSRIHYLMNDFDISYTYSATFLAESLKRKTRFGNRLLAFAPSYSEPINVGSVMKQRQTVNGVLPELPFAKQEAEYVASITRGKLYENDEARETVYKSESGKYDIIHLAMHTIINDRDPMYSTLIFSPGIDSADDRFLRTYEIYSIPLRAKMVVLSSCNSGSGYLYSGEGIISLARGFMYSGSESVVMAMWEVEDRTGTEIVKSFYNNLRKGYKKSSALRKARLQYLREADQLRSHPYFWSTLVVYGNNSPLYYGRYIYFSAAAIVIILLAAYYFWRRRNS